MFKKQTAFGLLALLAAYACTDGTAAASSYGPHDAHFAHSPSPAIAEAKADLIDSNGKAVGTATLKEQSDGVHIVLKASGLTPGSHGFHFHAVGKCEPPGFESAGAHFNPSGKEHGFENPKGFHFGDLPNVIADASGNIDAKIISKNVTLVKNAPGSLLSSEGSALIIHEKTDDYKTDPSGNSGNRIACGVIK
ncbi:superoxide dismutase family protein [Paenibacillus sp. NEAU-GSW1]|uniref:superoxide dismutase family protein n=1 Tax=Paenibacillus sp. NEAU-GSW1 TaxID=2682486 RepID=UPI0012E0F1B2|nr:superoxide dismutase family protein [Paenibacillus sp. NEAU-GSW1]MUT65999.1 superoxide dismutase [Paenibacillus sp. NEAU-GSW1]